MHSIKIRMPECPDSKAEEFGIDHSQNHTSPPQPQNRNRQQSDPDKNALYSGSMTLLNEAGKGIADIDRIILAGSFGS